VVGLALFVGVSSKTIYNWADKAKEAEDDGKSSKLLQTLSMISDMQHRKALNSGLTGDFNPMITKLVLANHGYRDKQETKVEATISHEQWLDDLPDN